MSTVELGFATSGRRSRAFVASAGLVGAALVLAFVGSNVKASLAQRSLQARWDRVVASGVRASAAPGEPVAQIAIPSIGLDTIVVEGPWSGRDAPVHLAATALPGSPGLAAIEAGRLGFGSFFARIDALDAGAAILVRTPAGVVRYTVIDTRVVDARAVDLSSNGDSAVLVLLAPASRLGGGERIVVRAREEAPR